MIRQKFPPGEGARPGEGNHALVFSFKLHALVPLTVAAVALSGCFSKRQAVLNKPVLVVNGHEISTKEFAERLAVRLKSYDALFAKDPSNLQRAKEETIRTFILEAIARDYAAKMAIEVKDPELEAEARSVRSRYPDDLAFRRALAEQNIAYDTWLADLRLTLLQRKVSASITSNLTPPSDTELKAFYEAHRNQFHQPARIRLRQIVLEKEDDARRILAALAADGDLERLAKQFSVAPEGANGGDTGWIEKGTLAVFDEAFQLPVGRRSRIVKSPYGYHIYQVLEKEPEGRLSFAQAKDKIRARLREQAEQKAFSAWLEERVRTSSVQRDDRLIQAITVTTRGS